MTHSSPHASMHTYLEGALEKGNTVVARWRAALRAPAWSCDGEGRTWKVEEEGDTWKVEEEGDTWKVEEEGDTWKVVRIEGTHQMWRDIKITRGTHQKTKSTHVVLQNVHSLGVHTYVRSSRQSKALHMYMHTRVSHNNPCTVLYGIDRDSHIPRSPEQGPQV